MKKTATSEATSTSGRKKQIVHFQMEGSWIDEPRDEQKIYISTSGRKNQNGGEQVGGLTIGTQRLHKNDTFGVPRPFL